MITPAGMTCPNKTTSFTAMILAVSRHVTKIATTNKNQREYPSSLTADCCTTFAPPQYEPPQTVVASIADGSALRLAIHNGSCCLRGHSTQVPFNCPDYAR